MHENKWIKVTQHEVELPNGSKTVYSVATKPDFVMAVSKAGKKFLLVRQFRYPCKRNSIEFPAGVVEEGSAKKAAARELEEETGFKPKKLVLLANNLVPSIGTMNQKGSIFLAEGLTKGKRHLDDGEHGLTARFYSLAQVKALIKSGRIFDTTTIAALQLYEMHEESKRGKAGKRKKASS